MRLADVIAPPRRDWRGVEDRRTVCVLESDDLGVRRMDVESGYGQLRPDRFPVAVEAALGHISGAAIYASPNRTSTRLPLPSSQEENGQMSRVGLEQGLFSDGAGVLRRVLIH